MSKVTGVVSGSGSALPIAWVATINESFQIIGTDLDDVDQVFLGETALAIRSRSSHQLLVSPFALSSPAPIKLKLWDGTEVVSDQMVGVRDKPATPPPPPPPPPPEEESDPIRLPADKATASSFDSLRDKLPSLAVDGEARTYWRSQSGAIGEQWWGIPLEPNRTVDKVRFSPLGFNSRQVFDYRVTLYQQGGRSVALQKAGTTRRRQAWTEVEFPPTECDYVRIHLSQPGGRFRAPVGLYEVEIWARDGDLPPPPPPPIEARIEKVLDSQDREITQAYPGDAVTILGNGFGHPVGVSEIWFGCFEGVDTSYWNNSRIDTRVPDPKEYPYNEAVLVVTSESRHIRGEKFTILQPSGPPPPPPPSERPVIRRVVDSEGKPVREAPPGDWLEIQGDNLLPPNTTVRVNFGDEEALIRTADGRLVVQVPVVTFLPQQAEIVVKHPVVGVESDPFQFAVVRPPAEENRFAREVLELTNEERRQEGLPALKWDPTLAKAAQDYAATMFEHNHFSHTGPDGSSPGDRIRREGYVPMAWGENIAKSYPTPQAVVNGWMNSEGHKRNILNSTFTELGVGYHNGYWVQNFGRPR